ncbi:sensor histidine kinase [Nonomuraea jiangxiensis]|uniref:histidine kinase n=1 Tax=Nonomuraea jiangxiensis TaxID=633440 RepID=A0A1G8BFS0_9ACTN|nr:HAMP domain-containing sensor histidine kinase [Nonomuraea jiangxiensis]SDH31863.1 Signal transduction histidine kinase [Nonomuraea jiangxiensis]
MITRLGRSIRARLAMFASAAMAVLCLATSSVLLLTVHNTVIDIRTNQMLNVALRVVHLIKRNELPRVVRLDLQGLQVVDNRGRVVASTPNLVGAPRLTSVTPGLYSANRTGVVCGLPQFSGECQITVAFRVYGNDGRSDWFVYAYDTLPPWYVSPMVIGFLAGVSLFLVMLTWFGVSRVVAGTLAPVNRITRRLAMITAGDATMRVPVPRNADEIKELAETANQMLARLESVMEQQRRFASDASHDLRSPITAMRTELEEALISPDETDWRQTCSRLMLSLDRLQNIVTDLLTLAKLDAGAPGRLEPVDLADLVSGETTRARSKRVVTSLQPGVIVTGDRLRLARLLTNLLDNAERHAESTITVTVRQEGDDAVMEVVDDGAGIAPQLREVVFRRFTRLDASRSRDAGGTGLGLPIAREIARIHHGTLTIEDSEAGARFVLRMPIRMR